MGSPLLIGVFPFGLIYGAAAREAGLSLTQTVSMSLLVFAGSAQFVFVELWQNKAAFLVLVLTCLALNLRLIIYGASLSQELGPPRGPLEALIRSYMLTDESYVSSAIGFRKPGFSSRKLLYYLGAGLPTWLGWQSAGLIGYLVGSLIPPDWPMVMAAPLIFLALLISLLRAAEPKNRPVKCSAAIAAGLAAIAADNLPLNLGLLLAIAVGVGVALWLEQSRKKREDGQ
jgi:predicted branched-subunit amino acid permease